MTERRLSIENISFPGIIYAFNVKAPEAVRRLAEAKKVTIRNHNIIYKLYDDLKVELNNRIPITTEMEIIGQWHAVFFDILAYNFTDVYCRMQSFEIS